MNWSRSMVICFGEEMSKWTCSCGHEVIMGRQIAPNMVEMLLEQHFHWYRRIKKVARNENRDVLDICKAENEEGVR